jgi:hypothetical protein
MPLRDKHVEYLLGTVNRVIYMSERLAEDDEEPAAAKVKKIELPQPTIQDRIAELVRRHQTHFEEIEDEVFAGKAIDPKAYEYLAAKNVPQAMLAKILQPFEQHWAEIQTARDGECEQLQEAYAHLKTADYRRIEQFYNLLFDAFAQYGRLKKATKKAAVRRPPQKEKIVSKLNYLKTDGTLKLVSINPVDIIGATTLWVYNVKSRKIGRYVADSHAGTLGVKGTSVVGFDEVKSTQKTLRKPPEQLKEFMSASKVELRKWMDTVKATEIKLNGRINADTILLKIQ